MYSLASPVKRSIRKNKSHPLSIWSWVETLKGFQGVKWRNSLAEDILTRPQQGRRFRGISSSYWEITMNPKSVLSRGDTSACTYTLSGLYHKVLGVPRQGVSPNTRWIKDSHSASLIHPPYSLITVLYNCWLAVSSDVWANRKITCSKSKRT